MTPQIHNGEHYEDVSIWVIAQQIAEVIPPRVRNGNRCRQVDFWQNGARRGTGAVLDRENRA
ncbi:MAG: hypothetical protein WAU82_07850 [Candidatus Binatus sp.]|uniref:hypothetical protein n=1 Tax=Candidatus Binatus sp. TaxID=2811406 RepID=UPI003BAFF9F7